MATITLRNPDGVHAPAPSYSHAALVEGTGRRLVISGQVGLAPDGSLGRDGPAQIAQALANLKAILEAHGMAPRNIVKNTIFLTDRTLIADWRSARNAFFGEHRPASTLLLVAGLADPRFVVEVEAEAVD
jgi:enamine deaminase RidA (YjgF/YER057c/UK114 family)